MCRRQETLKVATAVVVLVMMQRKHKTRKTWGRASKGAARRGYVQIQNFIAMGKGRGYRNVCLCRCSRTLETYRPWQRRRVGPGDGCSPKERNNSEQLHGYSRPFTHESCKCSQSTGSWWSEDRCCDQEADTTRSIKYFFVRKRRAYRNLVFRTE